MKDRNASIFVIDDDEATNFITRLVLEEAGYSGSLSFFDSARQALAVLSEPSTTPPDLILLDINMPGMDGWEFADEFLKLPSSSRVITVMFSTSDTQKDRTRALAHPIVSDFLQKPLCPEVITAILEKIYTNAVRQ